MMRWLWVPLGLMLAAVLCVAVAGWRGMSSEQPPRELFDDMSVQPRYNAQSRGEFFDDKRSMRPPVVGTVPFGGADYLSDAGSPVARTDLLREDRAYYRGTMKYSGWLVDEFVPRMPVKFDRELLDRGKLSYGRFCAVCHGASGSGNGITTKYGMTVTNLHQDRFRTMPDGEIFHVISQGRNTMQPYAAQIKPADRWAIVAWVRVLQRSQNARLEDVPEPQRTELERRR